MFDTKMFVVSGKNNLGCEGGWGLTVSFTDYPHIKRIVQPFSENSLIFWNVIFRGRHIILKDIGG